MKATNPYARHRFRSPITNHCVWGYIFLKRICTLDLHPMMGVGCNTPERTVTDVRKARTLDLSWVSGLYWIALDVLLVPSTGIEPVSSA